MSYDYTCTLQYNSDYYSILYVVISVEIIISEKKKKQFDKVHWSIHTCTHRCMRHSLSAVHNLIYHVDHFLVLGHRDMLNMQDLSRVDRVRLLGLPLLTAFE